MSMYFSLLVEIFVFPHTNWIFPELCSWQFKMAFIKHIGTLLTNINALGSVVATHIASKKASIVYLKREELEIVLLSLYKILLLRTSILKLNCENT